MISSRNIDLTENNDFGFSNDFTSLEIRPISSDDILSLHLDSSVPITYDTYLKIWEYESIFGERCHHNEFIDVFDKSEKFDNEIEYHCYRCGKPLRIPWRMYRGLCDDCNEYIDLYRNESDLDNRVPWKQNQIYSSSDVLSLR